MKRILLSYLLLCFALLTSSARAARIYELVNYPNLQNGHTLSGTITTTDDASDDSLLEADEILDWQWSISGPNNFTAVYEPPLDPNMPTTRSEGIAISPTMIELPRVEDSLLVLSQFGASSRGPIVLNLVWFADTASSSSEISLKSSASFFAVDVLDLFWLNDFSNPNSDTLTIATLVPEPSSILMVAVSSLFFLRTCRRSAPASH